MVLPLGLSKFYGSSLPRPRIYSNLKFNSERVDPPIGVTAPFLSWATDAYWSMGGLSHKRKRMAGKIGGSLEKLRDQEEKDARKKVGGSKKKKKENQKKAEENENENSIAKEDADFGSPKMKPCSPDHSSPFSAQIVKPKRASEENDEDCSLVTPASADRYVEKHSPRVRIQGRKLGHIFGSSSSKTPKTVHMHMRPRAHSLARSALKRHARKITKVYDYVSVPDKIMQMPTRRVSPRKNNKDKGYSESKPAGFEPQTSPSSERETRHSSRILSFSPVVLSKGIKRIGVLP